MVFKKGVSGNPGGKPKGTKHSMTVDMMDELLRAIANTKEKKEISKGKSILEHFVERAYKSDTVLNAFMKKLIPDRTFNIEDFRNGNIKVVFEIVDAQTPKTRKEKQAEFGEKHNGTKLKNSQNYNGNSIQEIEEDK